VQQPPSASARSEAWPDLIERARHDRTAFGELYDLYLNRVYAFCLSRMKNREEAEDVTAQTFERALKSIATYESRGAPMSSWLFRIAANLVTDRVRRQAPVVNLGDDPIPDEGNNPSREPDPEDQALQWERALYLRELVAALAQEQQRALRLRYFQGKSVAEVAEALGKNENATKQLLHRAMENMRRRMRGESLKDV
jgi:RNA polymerase sigma-70 factor (ECF subfamily)